MTHQFSTHAFTMSEETQLVFGEEDSNLEDSETNVCRRRCPRVLLIFIAVYLLLLALFLTVAVMIRKESARPHVILIIVDDLGWDDVELNDDGDTMRSPALKALLENGVLLNNSYAHPLDAPSRAALFTGMYPFHMGLQHETMDPYTPTFIPDDFTLLPSHLQRVGYKTHLVGKWHLGFCNWRHTPLGRGFGSFAGFYTDELDYYTHRDDKGYYDFRSGEMVDMQAEGIHSVQVLTDRAVSIIRNHDKALPLFLTLAHQSVHSPVQVPQLYVNDTCGHINDTARQLMCALVAMMDEGIGNVTSVLRDKDMLKSSVIIVTSDSGGVMSQGSSNGPFRGGNGQLYEGGTRVISLLSSPSLLSPVHGTTHSGLFHQVDWVPTILAIAGVPGRTLVNVTVDGVNQWHAISTGGLSPRTEIIYNIDDVFNNAAIRVDNFKLIEGSPNYSHPAHAKHDHSLQLYDLSSDPGESTNLAQSMPDKVVSLQERVTTLRKSLAPSAEKRKDPKADPGLWGGVWSPGWC